MSEEAKQNEAEEESVAEPAIKNGNGLVGQLMGTVSIILALAGFVAAIIRPMQTELDSMSRRIDDRLRIVNESSIKSENDLKERIHKLEEVIGKWSEQAEQRGAAIASIREKFAEVETQFRGLDERTRRMEAAFDRRLEDLDKRLQMELDLKLKNITDSTAKAAGR